MQKRKKSKHYHITFLSDYYFGISFCYSDRKLVVNASDCYPQRQWRIIFRCLIYCNISGLCNRIDYTRYGNLLVCVRTEYHFVVDSDWRNGNCYNCCFDCGSFRTQNRLMQRSTMQEAIAAPNVGGIVRRTKFILKTAISVELIGAAVLAPVFCRDFGFFKGIWYALFHSISAFCNAGFDLIGAKKPFSSLTSYSVQPVVNITIMALIIIGGIGFLTWEDIKNK